jgi:dTDP-4-dehydrorhamnose reductase
LGRDKADLSKPGSIRAIFAEFPCRAVVNAAAYTAVDKAQSDADAAFAVNRDGPDILAQACHEHGLPLIHYSTDYVFDGRKPGPYGEDDAVTPLSVYGASKAAGEEAVRNRCAQHIILRTSWIYSVHGHNFVKTMFRLGAELVSAHVV